MAMRGPRSLPLKRSVHPQENDLHKRPAFRPKEMSKEIPLFRHHTHCRSVPNKSMLPPPRPFWPSPNEPTCKNRKLAQIDLREKRLHQMHHVESLLVFFLLSLPRSIIHVFPCTPLPPYILSVCTDQGYVLACHRISPALPVF